MEALATAGQPEITGNRDLTSWNLIPFLISDAVTGQIIQANELVAKLTGHTPEQLRKLNVIDLGLWESAEQRNAELRSRPLANPTDWVKLKTAAGNVLDVMHGWQSAILDGRAVVSEVFVDMSLTARTQERLERLSQFRTVLSEVLSESLRHGLDDGFYQRILQSAVDNIPGAQVASLLVREEDGMYRFHATVGCDLNVLKGVSFTEEQMVHTPSNQPMLHYGYADNSELPEDMRDEIYSCGPTNQIKVSIVTPVVLDDEPLAVFNLDNLVSRDAFSDEALAMAKDFAQHIAVLLQRFRLEDALWKQANFDKLTGLPNRRRLDSLLPEFLERSDARSDQLAVGFIDLDNFKNVNDTYGHTFGDKLVRAVTERLEGLLPPGAILARWGGDELVAILPEVKDAEHAGKLAARLIASAQLPYTVENVEIHASLSMGMALYPDSGDSAQVLLQNADVALYRAKQAGRSAWRLFDEPMQQKLALQMDIRRAVVQDEIDLHYQPRYDLQGRLVTLEALARWNHPEHGLLPASAFIDLAEGAGLMQQLGLRLLDRVVQQARAWLDAGLHAPVAFNMSASQLASPLLTEQVAAALRKHALPAHLLELQITETSAVVDVPDAAMKLMRLRNLGIRLLLDEIGNGLSSLAMLRRFNLDGIKISREFIKSLDFCGEEPQSVLGSGEIIRALVSLGRDLNVQIIAEGVETPQQLDFVRAAGVTQVQGFLFSDALPVSAATGLIQGQDSME